MSHPQLIRIPILLHSKTPSWTFRRVIQVYLALPAHEYKANEVYERKCAPSVTLMSACFSCAERRKQLNAGKRTRFLHWPTTLIGEYLILALKYTSPWSSMRTPFILPIQISCFDFSQYIRQILIIVRYSQDLQVPDECSKPNPFIQTIFREASLILSMSVFTKHRSLTIT